MKLTWVLSALVVSCLCSFASVSGSNVLMIAGIATKSHMNFYNPIATTLAARGHKVTMVSSYKIAAHENISHIDVQMPLENFVSNVFEHRTWWSFMNMVNRIPESCAEALGRDGVQKLNVDDYDVVFLASFINECFCSMLEDTKVPIVGMIPNVMFGYMNTLVGNVGFSSFVNIMGLHNQHPLTFLQRFQNVLMDEFTLLYTEYHYYPSMEVPCQQAGFCREDLSLKSVTMKTSVMFINSIEALEVPARPSVPAVIHAGGLNCHPVQPLPKNIESWIENSGEFGVIYVSFGSVVKTENIPEKYLKVLVKVFGSLPQRILWKWDQETMEDLPPNVMLSKWFPQQDVLGHEKTKLFISHGGLFSTTESTYHSVPILGMPVFADQMYNIDQVVRQGYAKSFEWDDLEEESFRNCILDMINNKSYTEIARKRSELMRDQPMSPQEVVSYWTEYVIRHRGAPHLRSPVKDMARYQLYNLDVWALLVALLIVTVVVNVKIGWWLLRFCVRRVRGTDKSQKLTKKKKH